MKLFVTIFFLSMVCTPVFSLCRSRDFCTEYPTYPTPSFSKVEKICKGLLLDLDALNFNKELHTEWVEKSDYLFNQFLLLVSTVNNLVNNHEECRSYLREDIHYLQEVLCLVEQTFIKVYPEPSLHTYPTFMHKLIQESVAKFEMVASLNQEVIL